MENNKKKSTNRKPGNAMTLKCLQLEYQNIFERSNKLDNKVYIAITFCGFLFVFITGLFSGISRLQAPVTPVSHVLTILYILACIMVMIAYAYVLVLFIKLLSPEELVRFEPESIECSELNEDDDVICTELCAIYEQIVRCDLNKLEHRCHEYKRCLRYIVPTVVLAFVTYVLQILLQVFS